MEQNNKDIMAGIAVFLASAYIVIVNPTILSQAGMPFNAVLTATVLVTAICTIAMGLWAKNPILVAPGMGLNAYFTFSIVKGMNIPYEVALGMVVWSGVFFLIFSLTKVRSWLVSAIPHSVRIGVSAGIGFFIATIGLVNAGIVVSHPVTLVTLGPYGWNTAVFALGLILTGLLIVKKVPGAFIISMVVTTLLAIPIGRVFGDASAINHGISTWVQWNGLFQLPDFSLFLKADLIESLKWVHFPVIFSLIFTDLFDSLSTLLSVSYAGNLIDKDGQPRNIRKALIVDAFATFLAGLFGSSAGTSYIESTVGIEQGGKTGLVAITAGVCFLPLLFLSPLLSMIPSIATAPVLVMVGAMMINTITHLSHEDFSELLPVFLAFIITPLTYSITNGIVWGLISYTMLKCMNSKWREIPGTLWVINALIGVSFFV